MNRLNDRLRSLFSRSVLDDDRGLSTVEYTIILVLIAVAGIGLSSALEDLPGTVIVYGCPAEEAIGGKVYMAQAGVFDGLDIALTTHPGPGGHTYNPVVEGSGNSLA